MKVLLATRKWSRTLGNFMGWMEGTMHPAGDSAFNILGTTGNVLVANISVAMLEREQAAGRIMAHESREEFYIRTFGDKV